MKQYIISSFISKFGGGNKAAVVFDDRGLSEKEMKAIAKKNNLSETAFISIKESSFPYFTIRYFTPEEEVDICGHAALASFYVLEQLGYFRGDKAYHLTKAGRLTVLKQEDVFLIQMKDPEVIGFADKDDIKRMTSLKEEDIIANMDGNISIISTGLKDAIIEVDSLRTLKNMSINKEEMISFCKRKDIVGAHVFSRETIEDDSDFSCRNFAPAVGIDEESATGTSNASLIYYVKAFADFKEEGINPLLNEVSFNTELSFPKSPTLICGECPRAAKSSTPGHLLLPQRGNSPCMDSANTQQGINPPLNEVSFNT
ncbi:MAG: PhzF family phenazine biosynthesis protein, partial [Lutispora sp.]|nr:PhzF family phenazine biosynthesis protein [Lutispora sp.]